MAYQHNAQVLTIKNVHITQQTSLESENQINEQWNNHELPKSTKKKKHWHLFIKIIIQIITYITEKKKSNV